MMKTKTLILIVAIVAAMSSCTSLVSGDSFNQTIGGVEYKFEVIVSHMTFVRLSPVSSPSAVKGKLVLPSTVDYGRAKYTVTQIGERAFRDYIGLTAVTLPKTLSQIEKEAFAGCILLQEVDTPQPLAVIGDYAFDGCISLKEISLDASISELGKGAFRDCASLEELEFTPSFSAIPAELCSGCLNLTQIDLPSTIMEVGDSAFEGCASVSTIKIDRSLQTVGDKAFAGCVNVTSISCMTATPPVCSTNSFNGIAADIPVTVPMAAVANYRTATGWNRFENYVGKY